MTITFKCPSCGNLCAFDIQYAGRAARCTRCSSRFRIPEKQGYAPRIIQDKPQEANPKPGFYKAVLRDTVAVFTNPENTVSFVFIASLLLMDFFIGHTDYSFNAPGFRVQLPIGQIVTVIVWLSVIWFFFETISEIAQGNDQLPRITFGGFFGFVFGIFRNSYFVISALIIAILPFGFLFQLFRLIGLDFRWLQMLLVLAGLFLFPITLLTLVLSNEIWKVFRYDLHIKAVTKNLKPYLLTSAVFISAVLLETAWFIFLKLRGYENISQHGTAIMILCLTAHLFVNILAIAASVILGLFAKHHCHQLPQI